MLDCPESCQSGTRMKKMPMSVPVPGWRCPAMLLLLASLLWLPSRLFLAFLLFLGPAVVDIPSVSAVSIDVVVPSAVGVPTVACVPSILAYMLLLAFLLLLGSCSCWHPFCSWSFHHCWWPCCFLQSCCYWRFCYCWSPVVDIPFVPVPEFIDPVFAKTGSINSGTGVFTVVYIPSVVNVHTRSLPFFCFSFHAVGVLGDLLFLKKSHLFLELPPLLVSLLWLAPLVFLAITARLAVRSCSQSTYIYC